MFPNMSHVNLNVYLYGLCLIIKLYLLKYFCLFKCLFIWFIVMFYVAINIYLNGLLT